MFSKVILVASLVAVSTAASLPVVGGLLRRTDATCNTGPVQCCQNIAGADGPMASQLLALLGVAVQDVNVPIGVSCNPITGIELGSASWWGSFFSKRLRPTVY